MHTQEHRHEARNAGIPTDTSENARRAFVRMVRESGPARQADLASHLSNQAREAIARNRPDLSKRERDLLYRMHYGEDLENRLRRFFNNREENDRT